jgi:GH18 family chitinase
LHNSPALDFSTLTHLNLSFANTVEDGSIDFAPEDRDVVSAVIARAKQSGVKVLASVGGGKPNAGKELQDDLTGSVEKLLTLVAKYDLDGIDVDIEGDAINKDAYPKLLDLLSQKLPSELVLSVAVAEYRKDRYGALDKADFLSVMSYDKCGSFNGGVACEQSPYEDARDQLAYWAQRTAAERVVLGMPFFARCWGAACDTRDKC